MHTEKRLSFRDHHLLQFLLSYENQSLPLDYSLSLYFKSHKSLGSKDRLYIGDFVYKLIRWKGLLDYLIPSTASWEKKIELLKNIKPENYLDDKSIPLHIRLSFPKILFEKILHDYGEGKAIDLCITSNQAAPTTIRINPLKTSREELLEKWNELYKITPTQTSPYGIKFLEKIHFFSLSEFKEGLFEIQDEASQLIALLIKAEPGQQVLDYCAGSGGKTLAFAPFMQNKGQIYLHDIRPYILLECKHRLKRAGIQNAQIINPDSLQLSKLKKKFDWVLVDAPCSGTGTLRRNPDMKWRFTEEMLKRLVGQQRTIFEKALSFLKPSGKIVYATCSLLQEENEKQIEHFLKTYPLKLENSLFQTLPTPGSMDGFFGATLKFLH